MPFVIMKNPPNSWRHKLQFILALIPSTRRCLLKNTEREEYKIILFQSQVLNLDITPLTSWSPKSTLISAEVIVLYFST